MMKLSCAILQSILNIIVRILLNTIESQIQIIIRICKEKYLNRIKSYSCIICNYVFQILIYFYVNFTRERYVCILIRFLRK